MRFLFYTISLLLANFLHKRKPYLTTFGKPFISAKPTVLADNSLILLNCFFICLPCSLSTPQPLCGAHAQG